MISTKGQDKKDGRISYYQLPANKKQAVDVVVGIGISPRVVTEHLKSTTFGSKNTILGKLSSLSTLYFQ